MHLMRFLPRFQAAYRGLRALEARERWTRNEIDAYQLERLNAIWRHASVNVPYYRNLAARLRLPERFASLDEYRTLLPPLQKAVVRRDPSAFHSDRAQVGRWHSTGGSTGMPMRAYWGRNAHAEMLRCKYRHGAMWGLDIFDRTVFLWGHGASLVPGIAGWVARVRQPIEDLLRNRLRLSAYYMGREDARRHLARIAAFRPALVYGYSSALYLLALEADAMEFLCPSLKMLTLTSDPAYPSLVRTVEQAFGVPAAIEYGSVECGVMATEFPDRTLRVCEHTVMLETPSREDGRHDIVVSILNNPSFPLLRYEIGDVTDAPLEWPSRGFAVLKNVVGRDCDFMFTRRGRTVHPARFEKIFEDEVRGVRRYRAHQHADGSVSVLVETDEPSLLDTGALCRRAGELLEGFPVEIKLVDKIPQTPAGKHRFVVSDLDHMHAAIRGGKLDTQHDNCAAFNEPADVNQAWDATQSGACQSSASEGSTCIDR